MRAYLIVILLTSVFLPGCRTFIEKGVNEGYAIKPLSEESTDPYLRLVQTLQKVENCEENKAPKECVPHAALVPQSCFNVPVDTSQSTICKTSRNQAIAALSIASSNLCLQHRQSIYGREAGVNIALGSLANLFAGSAAIATGEHAKTIYAALTLFFNSERSLVNETVYKQMIVTAVDQKIVETMDTKGATLKQSLGQDINNYGIYEALRDVIELHNSCSFMTGLRKALEEGTQGSSTKKMLRLRQNLLSLNNELTNNNCNKNATDQTADANSADTTATSDKQASQPSLSIACTQIKQRYESVSTALKALESSGE